jgi:hypothetical protein
MEFNDLTYSDSNRCGIHGLDQRRSGTGEVLMKQKIEARLALCFHSQKKKKPTAMACLLSSKFPTQVVRAAMFILISPKSVMIALTSLVALGAAKPVVKNETSNKRDGTSISD